MPDLERSLMQLDETALRERLLAACGQDEKVVEAVRLASDVHVDSARDEGTPYIRHPLRVALLLAEGLKLHDPELICAALLHDVLEDSPDISADTLGAQFGRGVAALVTFMTDELKGRAMPRAERKARYLSRFAQGDDRCLLLKLCDRLDNVRSLIFSRDPTKKASMIQETRTYLMPAFATRTGPFTPLEPLMTEALMIAQDSLFLDRLRQYQAHRGEYQELAEHLQDKLGAMARSLGIYPIVMGRAKSLESFAEKIHRTGKHYADPLAEMTDLCGVRVITHTLDQTAQMAEAVRDEFVVDALSSEDKAQRLAYREFGYLSTHFIIQLKEPPKGKEHLPGLKAELQIRTLAQHLWADIYHELGYKNEFQLPQRWEREFARLAALLENCDRGFQEIKDAMTTYESSYGAYMSSDELKALEGQLEVLLQADSDNVRAMHRLIRTYLGLGKRRAIVKLHRQKAQLQRHPPALRDIGVAYCQVSAPSSADFKKGQKMLEAAIQANPRDIDGLCSLGGTLKRQGKLEASTACYRDAHDLDPTNPYALVNLIALELIVKKDAGFVRYFRTAMAGATERCRKQIDVRVNLPWAFFDLGSFHLYLGNPISSFAWYAKGLDSAAQMWMMRSAHSTIRDLLKRSLKLDGLDLLDRLLKLARWTRGTPADRRELGWSPKVPRSRIKAALSSGTVVALAGGCEGLAHLYQPRLDSFGSALEDALRGLGPATLVSGGTQSGISHVAGNLQEAIGGTLVTIGYTPKTPTQNKGEQLDPRYRHHRFSAGAEFSALESLTFWEDFLASGGNPRSVKVIGFNGGPISGLEYRMALAFGAQVGLISESGRAADELLNDPLWAHHRQGRPSLHRLDLSRSDLKTFLVSS